MKCIKYLILIICSNLSAQDAAAEKSLFGVQAGFAGIWINNEFRIADQLVVRTELGLEHDFAVGDHYDHAGFILQPLITLEPRFYYNLKARNANGKTTAKNSGNFISVKASYHPDWFVINLDDGYDKIADLSIVPTWGIRRNYGHFNWETAIGLGIRLVYLKSDYYNDNRTQYTPYFTLRVGYSL